MLLWLMVTGSKSSWNESSTEQKYLGIKVPPMVISLL